MNVEALMTRDPKTCTTNDNLHKAANLMWEADCGTIPVVDESGRLCGVVTDRDLCMASYTQGRPLHEIGVAGTMSKTLFTLAPTDSIAAAMELLKDRLVRRAPVVNKIGALVGVLSIADIVHASANGKLGRDAKPDAVLDVVHALSKPRAEKRATKEMRDVIVSPAPKKAASSEKPARRKSRSKR